MIQIRMIIKIKIKIIVIIIIEKKTTIKKIMIIK